MPVEFIDLDFELVFITFMIFCFTPQGLSRGPGPLLGHFGLLGHLGPLGVPLLVVMGSLHIKMVRVIRVEVVVATIPQH